MYLKGRNGYFFKSFCQILNYRNLKMCDVRLNDNIKHTSGINLEGPSLIRRSRKVWAPQKKRSNCANGKYNTILLGGPEQGTLEKRKTNAILDKKMVQNSSLVLVCDSFGKNT